MSREETLEAVGRDLTAQLTSSRAEVAELKAEHAEYRAWAAEERDVLLARITELEGEREGLAWKMANEWNALVSKTIPSADVRAFLLTLDATPTAPPANSPSAVEDIVRALKIQQQ